MIAFSFNPGAVDLLAQEKEFAALYEQSLLDALNGTTNAWDGILGSILGSPGTVTPNGAQVSPSGDERNVGDSAIAQQAKPGA